MEIAMIDWKCVIKTYAILDSVSGLRLTRLESKW